MDIHKSKSTSERAYEVKKIKFVKKSAREGYGTSEGAPPPGPNRVKNWY